MARIVMTCMALASLLPLQVIPASGQGSGFVPGDRTIVTLDIAGTPVGGTPTGFRVLKGGVEAVDMDGTRMLRATSPTELLVQLPEALPENFTVEFDLIPKHCCNPEDLSFEGTPTLSRSGTSAQLLWWQDAVRVIGGGGDYQAQMPPALRDVLAGQLSHVAVSFEGTTLRMYTNGQRLYTLADRRFARGRVLRVFLGGQDADQQAVYLAGLRIAASGGATVVAQQQNALTGTSSSGGAASVSGLMVQVDAQGLANVSWQAVQGATSYFVVRWLTDDPACCNNMSPPSGSSSLAWQDGTLPKAGTYGYRLYATTASGVATTETQVTYQPGRTATVTTPGGTIATTEPPSAEPPPATSRPVGAPSPPPPATPPPPTSSPPPQTNPRQPRGAAPPASGLPGPEQTSANFPSNDGWGVGILWTPVPNATAYRVFRMLSATVPGVLIGRVSAADAARVSQDMGVLGALDPDIPPSGEVQPKYWVDALFADGTRSDPGAITNVQVTQNGLGINLPPVPNLRVTVGGTTTITTAEGLKGRGNKVTWNWDQLPETTEQTKSYVFYVTVEVVDALSQFGWGSGSLIYRSETVMVPGTSPLALLLPPGGVSGPPYSLSLPAGKAVRLCVSQAPIVDLVNARKYSYGIYDIPISCIDTQLPP